MEHWSEPCSGRPGAGASRQARHCSPPANTIIWSCASCHLRPKNVPTSDCGIYRCPLQACF